MNKVVITGMGILSPIGCTVEEHWQNLLNGKSGVDDLGSDFEGLPVTIGARVDNPAINQVLSHREVRRMSRSSQLAIVAAKQAVDMASLNDGQHNVDPWDIGVLIASSIGGFSASDASFRDYYLMNKQTATVIPMSMNSGPSANVSIYFGFRGPTMTVDAACASSAHSIGYVFNMIRAGQMDIALTGGADSPFGRAVVQAWANLRALSTRNDSPANACRPFSADRDGLVLGEGAAVFVLESEKHAKARGATILAEILGYAATSDGHHITQPSSAGSAQAMQRAIRTAGLAASDIDYINAHGAGTQWNDPTETAAIKEVLGDHAYQIPVVSNKGAIGHSIGSSGALELVGCVLSLRDQVVPPTINYTTPDPACDLDYVTEGKRRLKTRYVMSNSFAFGGSNGVLIIGPGSTSDLPAAEN